MRTTEVKRPKPKYRCGQVLVNTEFDTAFKVKDIYWHKVTKDWHYADDVGGSGRSEKELRFLNRREIGKHSEQLPQTSHSSGVQRADHLRNNNTHLLLGFLWWIDFTATRKTKKRWPMAQKQSGKMLEFEGSVSISVVRSSDGGRWVEIWMEDERSGVRFVRCKVEMVDFANSMMGCQTVPCSIELRNVDLIGKRRESTEMLVRSPLPYNQRALAKARKKVHEFEVDGWVADMSDLENHHRYSSEPVGVNVRFFRYVDDKGGKDGSAVFGRSQKVDVSRRVRS